MQNSEARDLAKTTSEKQKQNCEHNYEKEYFLSTSTGDYVCNKCGNCITEETYKSK